MNNIHYYNYEISYVYYLKLEMRVAMKYGPDTFYFTTPRDLDVYFFIGNPTLMVNDHDCRGGLLIRHLLQPLKVIT